MCTQSSEMKTKKKCYCFCLFLFCFIPIFIFTILVVSFQIMKKSKCGSNAYSYDPPFVRAGDCGKSFLQINISTGYLYLNSTPTDMSVTRINGRSNWSSGDLSVVPHPSMSNCSHIQRAHFLSLFNNLRSLPKFHLYALHSSSLLFFNCNSPQAVREQQYPLGFSRGGEACSRFTRSCHISNSSFDCFQLNNMQENSNKAMEALVSKLGCTSFTASTDSEDFESEEWPRTVDSVVQIGWKQLTGNKDKCHIFSKLCCGDSEIRNCPEFCFHYEYPSYEYPADSPILYLVLLSSALLYSVGAIVVAVILAGVVKRQSIMLWLTGEKYFKIQDSHEPPKEMSYRLLDWATRSFSSKIGEGGFAQVYSGTLPRLNTPLAVKVLHNARHSHGQFVAEVASIGNLHHVNLVRLIGFCSHKAKRLLVYEYIPNGSLDKHLFSNHNVLSWERRYTIILGVARGLAYLHHECRQQVVHLDIKPPNILLDPNFNPKIADFGLAKLMNMNQSKAETVVRGTLGYMAPELWQNSIVSTKCDVYSFGVLTVEVIAGRKLLEIDELSSQLYLTNWAFKKVCQNNFSPLVDERVACPEIMEQARNMILISMWCIQQDPCLRPSMTKVVEFIEGKDLVPSNPPNPFGSTSNIADPMNQELSTNDSSGSYV